MNIQCFEIWLQDGSDTYVKYLRDAKVFHFPWCAGSTSALARTAAQREQGLYGQMPRDPMSTLNAFQEFLLWTSSYLVVSTEITFLRAEQ